MKTLPVWVFLSLAITGLLLGPTFIGQAGSGGSSSHASARDFTITSSPSNLALTPGDSGKFLITLTSINGFRDRLTLSATSSPSGAAVALSTTSVTLRPNRPVTSELMVSSTSSTPTGGYTITVTATGRKISHSVDQSVTLSAKQVAPVGDFSISATPSSLTISQGGSATTVLAVTSINSFSGNVSLTSNPPAGISATINPPTLQILSGQTSSISVTITASLQTSLRSYAFNVTGASGSLLHSTTITTTVVASTVTGVVCIASSDSSTCPDNPALFTGTIGSQLVVAVNIRDSDVLNGFDIEVKTDPAILQPVSISLDGTVLQNVLVVYNNTDPVNGHVRLAAVALSSHTTAPTTGRLFGITYNIVGDTVSAIEFPIGCNNTSNGGFCVTVVNAEVLVPESLQTAAFSGGQPDFTISADPQLLIFNGQLVRSVIHLSSVGNFSGSIFLSLVANGSPLNVGEGLSPTTIDLPADGVVTAILEVFSAIPGENFTGPPGNFTIIVTGISGSLSHSVSVTVSFPVQNLPDFSIDVQPSTLIVAQGSASASKVIVTSIGGFVGPVYLEAAVFGDGTAPPTAFLQRGAVFLGGNGTASTFLEVDASGITPVGGYNVTVTGSSGPLSHTFVGAITIIPSGGGSDFSISADPTFLVVAGQPAFSTIILQSLNDFSGIVNLTAWVQAPIHEIFLNTPLSPESVTLFPGSTATATLEVSVLRVFNSTLLPGNFTITVTGSSGSLAHSIGIEVLVLENQPQDQPPVAQFSFFPDAPFVGDSVQFDGSRSFDPDGSVVSWTWNFGDCIGGFCSFVQGPFASHTYFNPGNYTVTMTVTDNGGLQASMVSNIAVHARALHDVGIVSVYPQPAVAVETQTVVVTVVLVNNGQSPENVQVSVFFDSNLAGTVNATVNNPFSTYVTVFWDTNGVTPGNYTISARVSLATDENPDNNSLTDGQVTILPPPTLTVNPNIGSLGTRVLVHGSGFPPPQYGPGYTQVIVTFDDMFMGFTLAENGKFNFTFGIPHAEPGLHSIKAFDSFSGVSSSTSFTVLPEPSAQHLNATVQVGTIYFPGDTVDIFVLVTVNGKPSADPTLELTVDKPDGSSFVLNSSMVQDGLFKASYSISASGSEGTYAVLATVQLAGQEASALESFEVKPPWAVQQAPALVSALSLTGLIGAIAVAWRKGVFRRKENDPFF